MQGWAVTHFDALHQGATTKAQRQWLERLLDLGLYLVIAWTVRHATGADFRRPADEVAALLAPDPTAADTPDYGRPPS